MRLPPLIPLLLGMVVLVTATHLPHAEPISGHARAAARAMQADAGAAVAREAWPPRSPAVVHQDVRAETRQAGLPCEVEAAVRPSRYLPQLALQAPALLLPDRPDSGQAWTCARVAPDPPPLPASQRRALLQVYLT